MMRRRALIPSVGQSSTGAAPISGRSSTSSSSPSARHPAAASKRSPSGGGGNSADAIDGTAHAGKLIIAALSSVVVFWLSLCVHVHLQLSVETTRLGARLRSRFLPNDDRLMRLRGGGGAPPASSSAAVAATAGEGAIDRKAFTRDVENIMYLNHTTEELSTLFRDALAKYGHDEKALGFLRSLMEKDQSTGSMAAHPAAVDGISETGGGARGDGDRSPPTVTSSNGDGVEGISACLLVNDENPRLPEWIAYHYQILPLRSLVVAVDPASRSSPGQIIGKYRRILGLDVQIWEEGKYMPYGGEGPCDRSNPKVDCLKHHRKRQQHFVRACMRDFKQRNKTWVLLTDVDEYISFNRLHPDTDPPVPLDAAPPGMPVLQNWTWSVHAYTRNGTRVDETTIIGDITGLPEEGWHGKKNGEPKTTLPIINKRDEIFYGAYGSIFKDNAGQDWFLRDDHAWREAIDVPAKDVPPGVPIIKDAIVEGNVLRGTGTNGKPVEFRTNWREAKELQAKGLITSSVDAPIEVRTIHGGHMMKDLSGRQYYVERDTFLWPPHLSTRQLVDIRRRLPTVADGKTILDVLNDERQRLEAEYANETIGPCLCLPRLLYGSREAKDDKSLRSQHNLTPQGFHHDDFVTLRYKWHSLPDNRVNKYQKTMIDVSRIPMKALKGEASNIHTPVKDYCREKQPPRFGTSYFRVNHYLDSFEAYSYRNDARADTRNCRRCYDDKGKVAGKQKDEDMQPWLNAFVSNVGYEKAKALLAGAGNFVQLTHSS